MKQKAKIMHYKLKKQSRFIISWCVTGFPVVLMPLLPSVLHICPLESLLQCQIPEEEQVTILIFSKNERELQHLMFSCWWNGMILMRSQHIQYYITFSFFSTALFGGRFLPQSSNFCSTVRPHFLVEMTFWFTQLFLQSSTSTFPFNINDRFSTAW